MYKVEVSDTEKIVAHYGDNQVPVRLGLLPWCAPSAAGRSWGAPWTFSGCWGWSAASDPESPEVTLSPGEVQPPAKQGKDLMMVQSFLTTHNSSNTRDS